jgi:hypothetical protein
MLYGFTGIQNYQQLWRNTIYLTHSHTISDISGPLGLLWDLGLKRTSWPQMKLGNGETMRNDANGNWLPGVLLRCLSCVTRVIFYVVCQFVCSFHQTSVQRIEIYNIVDICWCWELRIPLCFGRYSLATWQKNPPPAAEGSPGCGNKKYQSRPWKTHVLDLCNCPPVHIEELCLYCLYVRYVCLFSLLVWWVLDVYVGKLSLETMLSRVQVEAWNVISIWVCKGHSRFAKPGPRIQDIDSTSSKSEVQTNWTKPIF